MNFKEALNHEPLLVEGVFFDKINDGLNDFLIDGRVIHSYIRKSSIRKLTVFLSAVGINSGKPYPIFNRVSWENEFDGSILCFDDPTRKEIDFAPCFYFGDANHNCLDQIQRIVQNIASILNVSNSDIYIISSSNGGFAAMYLADKIDYSTCVALCPQFDVELFLRDRALFFYKKLNITREDYFSRLNLFHIINNNKSKFIIYSNIRSDSDREQIEKFCSFSNISYSIGLNMIKENFCLIISRINALDPHAVQPNKFFCNFIIDSIFKNNELVHEFIRVYFQLMEDYYDLELRTYILKKIGSVSNNVKNIEFFDNNITNVFMNDKLGSFFRIANYKDDKVRLSFRVRNFIKFQSLEFIQERANAMSLDIDYDSSDINIYSKFKIDFNQLAFFYYRILSNCFGIQ